MPQFKIRAAIAEDALAIATVQYNGWQQTYSGIVEQAYLDSLSIEKGFEFAKVLVASTQPITLIVENNEAEVIGYISGGKSRAQDVPCDGEVYALYVLRQYHGLGLGKQLFTEVVVQLSNRGYKSICLFVLKDNPAVHFYKKLQPDIEIIVKAEIGGKEYEEIGLGWNNANKISDFGKSL